MSEHYDALETRDPAAREREQFARLRDVIARAMTALGWAEQLHGVAATARNWNTVGKLLVLARELEEKKR